MLPKPPLMDRPLARDFRAGVAVFLVALPLCLGIALASTGRPDLAFSGVIAGVVGGVVVGALSGSALGVSGPAAGLVVIVLTALETLGSFEALLLATVLAGLFQLGAGYLKAGILGYYFPSSVIKGMLAAVGLTLILKELPRLLGHVGANHGPLAERSDTLEVLGVALSTPHAGALIIGGASVVLLVVLDLPAIARRSGVGLVPGPLLVVALGVGLDALFQAVAPELSLTPAQRVSLPAIDSLDDVGGLFRAPDLAALTNPALWGVAFTLAAVASLESLLSSEATDKLDPYRRVTPSNRELKAQGVGNIVSGLLGGLPVTQVVVRSTVNVEAGGVTRRATIIHGVILAVAVLLIPSHLNMIPLASLAAVLCLVGYKLCRPSLLRAIAALGPAQSMPFLATVTAALIADLLTGIGVGMLVALYFILSRHYRNNHELAEEAGPDGPRFRIRLGEDMTFLHKGSILLTLEKLPPGVHLVIDGAHSRAIDHDVLEAIQEFRTFKAPHRNIRVETIAVPEVLLPAPH